MRSSALILFVLIAFYSTSQNIRLMLNGDTTPVNKIDCWSFSRMDISFDYDKKVTNAEVCGLILSVENSYNTIHFFGELSLKDVKKEGTKNKKVDVSVFKSIDPAEETGYTALMSGLKLTRGTMYYEPDKKGEDTTWLTISVVNRQKMKTSGDKNDDRDEETQGETIGTFNVVYAPKKIMMLNRSWVDGREWAYNPDIIHPAGNCANINIQKNPDGIWERKNQKGIVVARGNYLNGKKEGLWLQFSEDGLFLKEVKNYLGGVPNGRCLRYENEGVITEKGSYREGKRNGTWYTFSNYGNPEYIFEYNKGELVRYPYRVDDFKKELGQPQPGKDYTGPKGEYSTSYYDSVYYKSGLAEGIYVKYVNGILQKKNNYKSGEEQGMRYEYNDDGLLTSEISYLNHQKHGVYRFYEDGTLRDEGSYKNDKREGIWKRYSVSKFCLLEEETWSNDERTGAFKEYFEDGKLKREGTFNNGEYDGAYKEYFDNGKLSEEGFYKKGKRVGAWKIYSSSGELYETKTY